MCGGEGGGVEKFSGGNMPLGHWNAKWNFRRLSGYKLAGNEIFLRHRSSGDWSS